MRDDANGYVDGRPAARIRNVARRLRRPGVQIATAGEGEPRRQVADLWPLLRAASAVPTQMTRQRNLLQGDGVPPQP